MRNATAEATWAAVLSVVAGAIWRSTDARRVTAMTLVAFVVSTSMACRLAQMAPGVNPIEIRRVSIGMTAQQVIAILGQPVRTRPGNENGVIYDYALPGMALNNVGLWIYFEKNAVTEVSAKRYGWIADDEALYDLRASRPLLETLDFERLFTR